MTEPLRRTNWLQLVGAIAAIIAIAFSPIPVFNSLALTIFGPVGLALGIASLAWSIYTGSPPKPAIMITATSAAAILIALWSTAAYGH